MSQNVAPLTKIVALFGKKIWGAFWRLLEQKRAVSDSELLNTLSLEKVVIVPTQKLFQNATFDRRRNEDFL